MMTTPPPDIDKTVLNLLTSGARLNIVVVAPCGHDIKQSKHTGTPSWQNRWTCKVCNRSYSR